MSSIGIGVVDIIDNLVILLVIQFQLYLYILMSNSLMIT